MRTILTLLLAFSLSLCFAQKEKGWAPLLDSLGANLYDSTGKYLVVAYSAFNEPMKKEIDAWLINTNTTLKQSSGALVINPKTHKDVAYKNSPGGEWVKPKK